jgi:branched-chain amino acid transport system permease protein
VNLAYGMVFGRAFAGRDALVKMMGTLGLALVLLGIMAWRAPAGGAFARFLPLPSSQHHYDVSGTTVSLTQIICLALGFALTVAITLYLRFTKLGTAMRAMANDREVTAMLGVPVRRVEAAAWFGTGIVAGAAGLLLPDLLTQLDYSAMTFFVIAAPMAAALIGRLRSLWATFAGGLAVGLLRSLLAPMAASPYGIMQELSKYRDDAPFVLAIVALLWLSRRRVVTVSRTAG